MTVYVVTRLGLNVSLTLRGRDTFDVQMVSLLSHKWQYNKL